jgi:hypothetical protein
MLDAETRHRAIIRPPELVPDREARDLPVAQVELVRIRLRLQHRGLRFANLVRDARRGSATLSR